MPTLSQLQTWLDEAYAARHKLRIGQMAQVTRYGERSVQFTAANAAELDAYISDLNQQISTLQTGGSRRGLIRVTQTGTGL